MNNGLIAAKHPLKGIAAFDPHAGLVRGHDRGTAQGRDGTIAVGDEGSLRPAQHVHQPALADLQAEEIGQSILKPFIGESLEGLEIGRHGMQPRPKRRSLCRVGHAR